MTVRIKYGWTLHLRFLAERLPLSLQDAIGERKESLYEQWCEHNFASDDLMEEITICIQHEEKEFQVTYTVDGESVGAHDERIIELLVLHIH